MKLRVLLALLAVMIAAAACTAPPELRNDQFLNDSSLVDSTLECDGGVPCWRGIVPGVTSWNTAISLIEDDPTLSNPTIETNEETGEVAATFQKVDGVPCCLIYSRDGTLVDQMLLQLAPDNVLIEVIENLGEPTYYSGTEVSPDQAAAALFYPDLNLVIYAFVAGAETGELSEDSEIFAALYLSEEDMDEVIRTSTLHNYADYQSFQAYANSTPAVTPVEPLTGDGEATDVPEEGDAAPEATATESGE